MLKSILQDASFLQLVLWIVSVLFLFSLRRIYMVARENRQFRKDNARMESWAATQQTELVSIHHDAQSWRAKTQRQFDAVRADLSARLEQLERANRHVQQQVQDAQDRALAAARARIAELEARAPEPAPGIPALPAMETLQMESLAAELAAAKAEAAAGQRENAALQRALLLARRKQPAASRVRARLPRQG